MKSLLGFLSILVSLLNAQFTIGGSNNTSNLLYQGVATGDSAGNYLRFEKIVIQNSANVTLLKSVAMQAMPDSVEITTRVPLWASVPKLAFGFDSAGSKLVATTFVYPEIKEKTVVVPIANKNSAPLSFDRLLAVASTSGSSSDPVALIFKKLRIKTGTGPWIVLDSMGVFSGADLLAPVQIQPANGAVNIPYKGVAFACWPVDKATEYRFHLLISGVSLEAKSSNSDLTLDLSPSSIIQWSVSAVVAGVETPTSEVWTFTTSSNLTGVRQENLPKAFSLLQNFPNPFNPTTNIKYSLASTEQVELKVYDMLGREVRTLVEAIQTSGEYQVGFDGAGLSSGIYIYVLRAGNFRAIQKMVLNK